jgi:hypothetical protein
MQRHLTVAPRQELAFGVFSVLSIAGGVAVSTVSASGESQSGWVIALGLIVAASTAINQITRTGQKSAVRYRAGNALRREGWDYVMGRGRYVNLSDPKAEFEAFYDAVWDIERPADLTVELESEGQAVASEK